jgi:hypothetical protein
MAESVLLPAVLQVDEYSTIWIGEPGAHHSTVVGDLICQDDTDQATIRFLQPDDWQVVDHREHESVLGGVVIEPEETEEPPQMVLVQYGCVPSWMEEVSPRGRTLSSCPLYRLAGE